MAKGVHRLSYWTLQNPKAPQKGCSFFWWCQPSPVSIVTLLPVSVCAHFVFDLVWLPCAGSSPYPPAQSFPLVVEILSSVKHRNFMCSLSEYETQPLIQSLLFLITWKLRIHFLNCSGNIALLSICRFSDLFIQITPLFKVCTQHLLAWILRCCSLACGVLFSQRCKKCLYYLPLSRYHRIQSHVIRV